MKFYVSLLLFICPVIAVAGASEWQLAKDREGIQVYTRAVEGSPYNAVKTVSQTTLSMHALVALLLDAPACARWADRCAESYVFQQVNPLESYVYTHNDMPFPVKDRDSVAKVKWRQLADGSVRMDSVAVAGVIAEHRGRLRLKNASASWRFKPVGDGVVEVINEAHIDPGSALPGWLTNLLLVETPHQTMKAFLAEASTKAYLGAKVPFIRER